MITGTLLSSTAMPYWMLILLAVSAVPFVLLAEDDRRKADTEREVPCADFNYNAVKIGAAWVVLLATFIVIVRGYMGYGIPTAWKKTTFQTVMLFVTMGIGKGAGGLIADRFGVKKTAMLSVALALPFLLCGDQHMLVSLVGVMFFSMTMSITLALLVSVLPRTPGLAFGLTTIGLFLGTAPIFFFKFTTVRANGIMISILTAVCLLALQIMIRKDGKRNAHLETSTETMSTTKKNCDATDWETAYIEYLKSLNEDSDHVSSLEYVEYAFVTMPVLEYPVLVVFGGWRDFYFYTFENGEIVTAKQEYEDGEGDLIEAWVDMPVYYLDGCLYFYGGNGAPATIFTNEVSVKDGALQSERVASKLCASAFGDRDYYHGRGEPEITESEYNTIVNSIQEKGKEVEFRSLKDLKG